MDITDIARAIVSAINAENKSKTSPLDSSGVVKRVEGDIAWVKLAGSDIETPVSMTIACSPGDTVQCRARGGKAWLTGNVTAPPTDDRAAAAARKVAVKAVDDAKAAHDAADDAQASAKKKAKTFQTTGEAVPDPPYSAGDIWLLAFNDDSGKTVHELYTCVTAKAAGDSFDEEDWTLSATDDATAAEALGIANSLLGWSQEVDTMLSQVVTSSEFDAMTADMDGRIKDLDWNGYLSLYGLDGGTPVVVIGNETLSAYVMMATNASLGFYRNNGDGIETEPTAYFGLSSSQNLFGLISGVVEAQKYLTMGNFVWIVRSDGGLTLKKVGA